MPPSIKEYVDITALVQGAQGEIFDFGAIMGAFEHSVSSSRLMGPYFSHQEMIDAGFTAAAEPEVYEWGQTVFGQIKGLRTAYVGKRLGGDASWSATLDAIEAVDPDAFYLVTIESRADDDIVSAAGWCQTRNGDSLKFGHFQSDQSSVLNGTGPVHTATVGGTATDGTYRLTFTGFGLGSPVNIDVVRSTTPATNADIAAALNTALNTAISGSLSTVLKASTVLSTVVTITFLRGLATGTLSQSAPAPGTITLAVIDTDVAGRLLAAGYSRCILDYYQDDADYLDAASGSRMGGFKVDDPGGSGALAYKQLDVVEFTPLDPGQAAAIKAGNANYYGRKRGLQFFFPGVTPKGPPYFADITFSVDWFVRRVEEAILTYLVEKEPKAPFSRAGILDVCTVAQGVADLGVRNGHFLGDPGFEPMIVVPQMSELQAADKKNRVLKLNSTLNKATFEGAIQKVELTIALNFAEG